MFIQVLTVLVVLSCLISVNSEFSDDFKPCKYGEIECIKARIEFLLKQKVQGYDAINLPQLYPLKWDKVHLQQGAGSPVTLDMVLKNLSLYGLETGKVIKVKGFGKNLTKKHSLQIHTDYFSTLGDYDVNGKILILPMVGSGTLNITFVDVDFFVSFVGKPLAKDGATYMNIEHLDLRAEPKNIIYKIDNLFNGDKVLGDNLNLFLNENWQEIFHELHPSLAKGFGQVFKNVIQNVFIKYPYEKFFTD